MFFKILFIIGFFIIFPYLLWKKSEYIEEEEKKKAIPNLSTALVGLIAVIMNADGLATKSELTEVKTFLLQRFGEKNGKKLLLLLKNKLQKRILNFRPHCLSLNRNLTYAQKLDFFTLLFRIADANEGISENEAKTLSQIARHITISSSDFSKLTSQFPSFYSYHRNRETWTYTPANPKWAYETLLINEKSSNEDIKKAYRSLAKKYHPDKVNLKDHEAKAQAAEKFRAVNEAYKYLKKSKGFV